MRSPGRSIVKGGGTGDVHFWRLIMNRHDQKLLDKQLSRVDNAPPSGVLMLVVAIVFCAGMAIGGFLFAYTDQPPLRLAANDIPGAAQSAPAPTPR
jgi:hypothetical protein